jgi:hypothetical protein
MAFEINIVRGMHKGRMTFKSGDVSVNTDCWWDPDVRIVAGTYTGYATRMATKGDGSDGGKRQAIWLGKKVPYNRGTKFSDGIFIHKGTSAAWSEGCVVAPEAQVVAMWIAINPKDVANVTVNVTDG